MNLSRKRILVPILIVLIALAGGIYFLKGTSTSENTVKILNYGLSICTQDIPTSDCGSYEVNVQSLDGKKATYKVAGFSNRESKHYNEITSKIIKAKEQNISLNLEINGRGEIISVR